MKIQIIEEEPIPIVEVKSILEKEAKKSELDIRANKTLEYAKRVGKTSKKKINEQIKGLKDLGMAKLKDKDIIKIVDIQPETVEELKIILGDSAQLFKENELKKIIEVLAKE